MQQAFDILKRAVKEAEKNPDSPVEVVDCTMGFTRDGRLTGEENAPIQIRFVAYPRHAKAGSAAN